MEIMHYISCMCDTDKQVIGIYMHVCRLTTVNVQEIYSLQVYCYYRCLDDGSKMAACDGECGNWYHVKCINTTVP